MMENAKVMLKIWQIDFEYGKLALKEASREADCECSLYMEE